MSPLAVADPAGKSSSQPSNYDLEFRSPADEAWYAARAILKGKKLTVMYDEDQDAVFEPQSFSDLDELREFESRFRSVSRKLRDRQCKQLSKGTAVCVSHSISDNDNRFYDAVVDDVISREHSFASRKEVCKCVFFVVCQNGPWKGCSWRKSLENIRIVQSGSDLDPGITRFLNMARNDIAAAASSSSKVDNGVDQPANGARLMEEDDREDADLGGRPDRYALLVDNLEKDVSSSALEQFIYQKASISVHVHVSSRFFPETFTKAVIVAESEKQLDELCKFLDSPTQIVVSMTGRPLVVIEKRFELDTLAMIRMEGRTNYLQNGGIGEKQHRLRVVAKGSNEYEAAKELKDLFVEFSDHQRGLFKKLADREKEMMQQRG